MPTVVLKLVTRQGTGWTDWRMDRRTKRRLYASPFEEHKKHSCQIVIKYAIISKLFFVWKTFNKMNYIL